MRDRRLALSVALATCLALVCLPLSARAEEVASDSVLEEVVVEQEISDEGETEGDELVSTDDSDGEVDVIDGAEASTAGDSAEEEEAVAVVELEEAEANEAEVESEDEAVVHEDGWFYENGSYYYYKKNVLQTSCFVVTSTAPDGTVGGLQRYWLTSDGSLASEGLYQTGESTWAYVRPEGYVVRGKYTASSGYVYLAADDGTLESAGWLVTGAYDGGGLQRYYVDADAHACVPGYSEDGYAHYTLASGYVLRGASGDWYADNDGKLASGWLVTTAFGQGLQRYWMIDGQRAEEGLYQTGDSSWTYVTSSRYVLRGKFDTGEGYVYVADNDGKLPSTTGWLVTSTYDGGLQRYYIDATTHAAHSGLFEVDGTYYYGIADEGYVVRGAYDTGAGYVYVADNDGKLPSTTGWLVTGAYTNGGLQRYYIDATTHAAHSGSFEVDGSHYWGMAGVGYVLRGKMTLGSGMLLADDDGKLAWDEGWLVTGTYDGGTLQRYYIGSYCSYGLMGARLGKFTVGSNSYYGRYDTGYVVRGYYYTSSGTLYYADNDGVLTTPPVSYPAMLVKAQSYSSSTNWLILVDTTNNRLCIYYGSKGNWVAQKEWLCTTGASSTPTVKGEFTVKSKGYSFGHGYTCYYYTQFYSDYLIHSIKYYEGTFNVMDGRLGVNASAGCVRLSLANAKWVYDNIPTGTKVVIY